MNIEEVVVNQLIEKKYRISFAESCTGGLAAATLVSVSDASKVFDCSFVTYANEAKMKYLGVSKETIKEYGVVSEEVAKEMAIGVAEESKSDVGVGVTGIAGPTGETKNKPIGMVCFGFYMNHKVYTVTKQFGNIGRNAVRKNSVNFVYEYLNQLLTEI